MTRRLTDEEREALPDWDFRKRQPRLLREAFANGAPPVVYPRHPPEWYREFHLAHPKPTEADIEEQIKADRRRQNRASKDERTADRRQADWLKGQITDDPF